MMETTNIQDKEKEKIEEATAVDIQSQGIRKALERADKEMKEVVLVLFQWKDNML